MSLDLKTGDLAVRTEPVALRSCILIPKLFDTQI
jgi:hypothetical protein